MINLDKIKKDLKTEAISLPFNQTVEERTQWLLHKMFNRRLKEEMFFDKFLEISIIAKKCHEANNDLLIKNNKEPLVSWSKLDNNTTFLNIKSVNRIIDNPDITPEEIHDEWVKNKKRDGWVYGKVKDDVNKTHPLIIAYDKMSDFDKEKDILFIKTVKDNIGCITN